MRVLSGGVLLPLLPLLSACGNSAGYPSLARQPVERIGAGGLARGCDCPPGKRPRPACETAGLAPNLPGRVTGSAPVAAPAPQAAGDATVPVAGVPELVTDAREAHVRFDARRAAAEAAVAAAAGAAPASEPWLRANQALVELDRARTGTGTALAALDRIALENRLAHAQDDPDDTADRPGAQVIRQAVATVSGWVEDEDAVLGALKQKFAGKSADADK